jgi:hypothetical protein
MEHKAMLHTTYMDKTKIEHRAIKWGISFSLLGSQKSLEVGRDWNQFKRLFSN